ncbi:hypothetical protein BpHYR1_000137 [Brachionus plicatilis]|uniref:Uncharacterized protein n=1 Tax=Brachionus plicatilis TaxID=10195 RepID=A0A3M7SCW1_BRAPC|nr:hypothetical protein BpHYR1_000137 [Brachionus plicatilis]
MSTGSAILSPSSIRCRAFSFSLSIFSLIRLTVCSALDSGSLRMACECRLTLQIKKHNKKVEFLNENLDFFFFMQNCITYQSVRRGFDSDAE